MEIKGTKRKAGAGFEFLGPIAFFSMDSPTDLVESGFLRRVGRLGTVWGYFHRSTSERQLRSATGSCDLALRNNPTS